MMRSIHSAHIPPIATSIKACIQIARQWLISDWGGGGGGLATPTGGKVQGATHPNTLHRIFLDQHLQGPDL